MLDHFLLQKCPEISQIGVMSLIIYRNLTKIDSLEQNPENKNTHYNLVAFFPPAFFRLVKMWKAFAKSNYSYVSYILLSVFCQFSHILLHFPVC